MAEKQKPRLQDFMPPELARTFGIEHAQGPVLPLSIAALDAQIGGGIPLAALTEIVGTDTAWWLAMTVLAAAPRAVALVDHDSSFFPPGAAALGVDLSRLLIVRESSPRRARWALERLARDKNIAVTLTWLPGLSGTFVRRLQLAAETSGQAVLILAEKPAVASRWCSLRLVTRPEPTIGGARRMIIEVAKMRGAAMSKPVRIEIDDQTHAVSSSAVSANGTADARVGTGAA